VDEVGRSVGDGGVPADCAGRARAAVEREGTVTDGPFTESKEIVGGFALIRVNSKEEAIKRTKTFLGIAGDGETEIRQVWE
jgi:hypothetical protein